MQLAKDLEDITKEIKDADIKDPKLKEFRNGYVNVFETFTQEIAKAAQALNSTNTVNQDARHASEQMQKDRENIDASLTQAGTTAGKQADTLASQPISTVASQNNSQHFSIQLAILWGAVAQF